MSNRLIEILVLSSPMLCVSGRGRVFVVAVPRFRNPDLFAGRHSLCKVCSGLIP